MEKSVKFRDNNSTYEITDFKLVKNEVIFHYFDRNSEEVFKTFKVSINECERLGIFNFDKLRWILK